MIETLSEKELFLIDLGYFDTSQLQKIDEQLDMATILKKSTNSVDLEVYIGTDSHSKLKVRLVGSKLPTEVVQKRIKKAMVENDGTDISDSKREILHWNLMITNIDANVLNTTIITELYRIRWQIELLFKVLKGTFSIDKCM